MRILLVAATELEVEGLKDRLQHKAHNQYTYKGHDIELLVSGVGMMATTWMA